MVKKKWLNYFGQEFGVANDDEAILGPGEGHIDLGSEA